MKDRIKKLVEAKLADLEHLSILEFEDLKVLELLCKLLKHCEAIEQSIDEQPVTTFMSNEELLSQLAKE